MLDHFTGPMLELFATSLWETLAMVGISGLVGALIGVPLMLHNDQYQYDSGRKVGKIECRFEIADAMIAQATSLRGVQC